MSRPRKGGLLPSVAQVAILITLLLWVTIGPAL